MKLTLLGFLASQYLNVPYQYGGATYLGMDCSGLVWKSLADIGVLLPRSSSQMLYDWQIKKAKVSTNPKADCLLYFGKSVKTITHVAIALDETWMIEAGGAGKDSDKLTEEELADRDARVRIKPIKMRRDLIACIPFTKE